MAASSRGATVEEAYVPQRPQPICLRPALKELAAPASRAAVVRRTEDEEDDDYDESGDEEDHKAEDKRNRTLDRERLLARCQEELTKYDNPQEYDDDYDESGSSDDDADVNLVDRFERQKEQERERREREEAAEAERKLSETMRSMRSASARELLDTERAYCDSLVALLELFVTPLSKLLDDGSTILDKTQQKQLFGNIPTLLKISREFCMVLEGRLNNWSDEQFIGDILLSTFPFMKIYLSYREQVGYSPALIQQLLESNKQFRELHDIAVRHPASKRLPLGAFLIMPIQRIPRYALLVENLLKYTPATHPDYQNLVNAMAMVRALASQINDTNAHEQIRKLHSLQAVVGSAASVMQPWRTYVLELRATAINATSLGELPPPNNLPTKIFSPSFPTAVPSAFRADKISTPSPTRMLRSRSRSSSVSLSPPASPLLSSPDHTPSPASVRSPKPGRKLSDAISVSPRILRSSSSRLRKDESLAIHLLNDMIIYTKQPSSSSSSSSSASASSSPSSSTSPSSSPLFSSKVKYRGFVSLFNTWLVDIPDRPATNTYNAFTIYNPSLAYNFVVDTKAEKDSIMTTISNAITDLRFPESASNSANNRNVVPQLESIDSLPSEFQKATILTLRQFSSLLFMLDTENTAAEALGTTRPRSSSTPRLASLSAPKLPQVQSDPVVVVDTRI